MSITLDDLFYDTSGETKLPAAGKAERAELLKSALADSHNRTASGAVGYDPNDRMLVRQAPANVVAAVGVLEKAYGAGNLPAEIAAEIQAATVYLQGEINKDWTNSNPVGGTGLTPYDLEGPAKILSPRYTPLRNKVPRTKGQGTARKYKRITSFSNDGISSGAGTLSPGFDSSTQTSTWGGPGNLTLNRPQKISYTGDDKSVSYVEFGLSDQVNWRAQFQGLGFDDLRSLSHTGLLYSHMMGEERALLYGRGTSGNGYAGTVSAPSGITTGTATTGGTIAAATYYVYVMAITGFGNSAVSTVVSQATTGATSTLTVTVGTEPTGALYYALYVGTTTGIANAKLQTTFVGTTYTMTSYNASGATTAGTDTSASATMYDGFLTVQADSANGGYFRRLNSYFSQSNPGSEIDLMLQSMYVANGADPDEIWMDGAVRSSYNQLMRVGGGSGAASGYRTNVNTGDGNAVLGTVIGGHMNPNTGKVVDVRTHRFMPKGSVLALSTSLPLPDSHIPAPSQVVSVQEYMAVDWPTIQMSYDASTYWIGTLVHYAPAWNGLILGVQYSTTAGV